MKNKNAGIILVIPVVIVAILIILVLTGYFTKQHPFGLTEYEYKK